MMPIIKIQTLLENKKKQKQKQVKSVSNSKLTSKELERDISTDQEAVYGVYAILCSFCVLDIMIVTLISFILM